MPAQITGYILLHSLLNPNCILGLTVEVDTYMGHIPYYRFLTKASPLFATVVHAIEYQLPHINSDLFDESAFLVED